jgi:hypothetical protein
MKKCSKCKVNYNFISFHKNKNIKDGHSNVCKECIKKHDAEHYIKNKEKILTQTKIWQSENKEHILSYQKIWYKNNKETIIEYHEAYRKDNKEKISKLIKSWIKNKKDTDPVYKSISNIRNRIYQAIKKGKGVKSKKTLELLGCSIEELKLHLEQQFKPEMTWENHGKIWEIDHIKACANFDLTDPMQQQKCFHYTNIQPLFKTTEIAKSFGYIDQIGNRNKHKN